MEEQAVHGDRDFCAVCLSQDAAVKFIPCGHRTVCDCCLPFLDEPRCIICRRRIELVEDGGRLMKWGEAFNGRLEAEAMDLQNTFQVLFLGPGSVSTRALVRELCSTLSSDNKRRFLRRNGRRNSTIREEGFVVGAEWNARFQCNSYIRGAKHRFSSLQVAATPTRRAVARIYEEIVPDMVVLCCDYHDPESFVNMVRWDKALRLRCKVPRMWVVQIHSGLDESPCVLNVAGSVEKVLANARASVDFQAPWSVQQVCIDGWLHVGLSEVVKAISRNSSSQRRSKWGGSIDKLLKKHFIAKPSEKADEKAGAS